MFSPLVCFMGAHYILLKKIPCWYHFASPSRSGWESSVAANIQKERQLDIMSLHIDDTPPSMTF